MIRPVTSDDAAAIASLYNYYIENTTITFETEPVSVSEMCARITDISSKYPYFVYEENGTVSGYCYANVWKKKHAYHTTVESTVYVDKDRQRRGIGEALMNVLIKELKDRQFHAIIACITTPNPESIRIHEKLGFRQVSAFREVGLKFKQWLDIGDWELILV